MCALKSNTEYVIFRGLGNLKFALVARPFELWLSDDKLYP